MSSCMYVHVNHIPELVLCMFIEKHFNLSSSEYFPEALPFLETCGKYIYRNPLYSFSESYVISSLSNLQPLRGAIELREIKKQTEVKSMGIDKCRITWNIVMVQHPHHQSSGLFLPLNLQKLQDNKSVWNQRKQSIET